LRRAALGRAREADAGHAAHGRGRRAARGPRAARAGGAGGCGSLDRKPGAGRCAQAPVRGPRPCPFPGRGLWIGLAPPRRSPRPGGAARRAADRPDLYRSGRRHPGRHSGGRHLGSRSQRGHYRHRPEVEARVSDGDAVVTVLERLGFAVSLRIDRTVEIYRLGQAVLRIEWYPVMDVLLEVEGEPAEIERAIAATGLPRDRFFPESLPHFVAAYEARTGRA